MFRSNIHKCCLLYILREQRASSLSSVVWGKVRFLERDHPTALLRIREEEEEEEEDAQTLSLSLSLSNDLHLPVAP